MTQLPGLRILNKPYGISEATSMIAGMLKGEKVQVESVSGAAKDVSSLCGGRVPSPCAGRAEILARIEFLRVFEKTLRMAAVMARRRSVSMFTLVQPTRRATSMSASGTPAVSLPILPPYLLISCDEILRHAGGAVQHERIIAQAGIHQRFLDRFEAFEVEMLFAFEFVGAMASCRWRRRANPRRSASRIPPLRPGCV